MYEDVWYNALVPGSARSAPKPPRRNSLLDLQPIDSTLPKNVTIESIIEHGSTSRSSSPPRATLERRARSFSDFFYVASLHMKKERDTHAKNTQRARRASSGHQRSSCRHALDFEIWRQNAEVGLLDAKQSRIYREQLHLTRQHLDSLLEDTSSNLDLLSQLSASFKAVDAQTSAFRDRCDSVVADQSKTSKLADSVSQNLQYYNYLDPITRRLNAPGAGHLVRNEMFPEMLANLDRCIEYMEAHPKQRESSNYRSRYRLLLTRALTLIRVYFTNTLRETAADVSARIADMQLNETTMPALLYAKFRVGAPEMKKLGLEIQRRAAPPPNSEPGAQGEYQSLLNELYQSYSAARGRLIIPLVRKRMAEFAMPSSASSDLVTFARSTVGYIRGVCLDEYELWHEWFDGDEGLYDFLEAVCDPLYDYLRPRTIKETQLERLCEMCSLIQAQYVEEPEDDDDSIDDVAQLDFAHLIRPALEDAQTRLVFLALSVLRNEIERFKPKPQDLDQHVRSKNAALSGTRAKGPVLSGKRMVRPATDFTNGNHADGEDGSWNSGSAREHKAWYPTLQKAIWLLSSIYRLVNSTVFDDLAHQIVHQTTTSLEYAAGQIAARQKLEESQLFLLRQLLILKSQIVSFDIEFVTPELDLDFSSFTNTFWELRERGGLFNPRNLVKLVGGGLMPGVVENMFDAKAELDGKLRTVINSFINGYASKFTAAVSAEAASRSGFDAGSAVQKVRDTIEKDSPALRAKLEEYLDDARTKATLMGAVQDQVITNYEEFFEKYKEKARANGKAVVSNKGKSREEEPWDADTFADWATGVFVVSSIEAADDDGTSSSPALSRVASAA